MKVTFLGTGTSQGVPIIACECEVCQSSNPKDKRFRSSLLIEKNGKVFLIDCGPDFRMQMLREKVKQLDAILFTHAHRDHIAGLDDIRAFNFKDQKPFNIYAEQKVVDELKLIYAYAFSDKKYPGVPELLVHLITTNDFEIEGIRIQALRGMHYQLPVLGFRIDDFAYLTDINYIAEEEKQKLIGVKYLIVDALRKKKHVSHFSLAEALELIREVCPRHAYLTHMSHQMGLHDEVSKELPANVMLGYDGLILEIS